MAFAPEDKSLSSDHDANRFLMYGRIEFQIFYLITRDFTS